MQALTDLTSSCFWEISVWLGGVYTAEVPFCLLMWPVIYGPRCAGPSFTSPPGRRRENVLYAAQVGALNNATREPPMWCYIPLCYQKASSSYIGHAAGRDSMYFDSRTNWKVHLKCCLQWDLQLASSKGRLEPLKLIWIRILSVFFKIFVD